MIGGLALVAAVAVPTEAQVIDFQAPTPNCYAGACVANGFNFSFVSGGWAITHDGNSFFNYNASGGILGAKFAGNGAPPTKVTMTKVGGGAFSMSELDAATGEAGWIGGSSLDLFGTYLLGGNVSASLSVSARWAHYVLSGFNNLSSLEFSNASADAGLSIDNLNLGPADGAVVPEPATLALLLPGLVGVAAMVRRKRQA